MKAFWKKEFGHLPNNLKALYEFHNNEQSPALISCSNAIFERPSDWNPHIHQKGYWFVEESEDYIPDQDLAVISGFGKPENLPDTIYPLESIPHTWLFKHVAAVCHHGGVGTSAAGFSAGVPSIIVPFSNDQFAWAHRSYDLGIGVKPIYVKDLNADNLSTAINDAYHPEIIAKVKLVGKAIKLENGAADCANVIVDLLQR